MSGSVVDYILSVLLAMPNTGHAEFSDEPVGQIIRGLVRRIITYYLASDMMFCMSSHNNIVAPHLVNVKGRFLAMIKLNLLAAIYLSSI